MVRVKFDVTADTKAASSDRDQIHSMDVFVFVAETGEMLSHDNVRNGSISLYLQRGILHNCCFAVNAPEGFFDDVTNYSQMSDKISDFTDNEESFVMYGEVSRMFVKDGSLDVEVSRLCSKIVVDNLVAKFMETEIASAHVELRRIFLMNCASQITYMGETVKDAPVYNENGYNPELEQVVKDQLVKEFGTQIKDVSPIALNTSLYCYSADIEDGVSSTMLILELAIAGNTNYYTVLLPKLKPNHEYHIDTIRLLGFGADFPGQVFDRTEVYFKVDVNPWGVADDKDAVMD